MTEHSTPAAGSSAEKEGRGCPPSVRCTDRFELCPAACQADQKVGLLRRLFRPRPHHRHEWEYGRRSGTGWGIARCRTCGETGLY